MLKSKEESYRVLFVGSDNERLERFSEPLLRAKCPRGGSRFKVDMAQGVREGEIGRYEAVLIDVNSASPVSESVHHLKKLLSETGDHLVIIELGGAVPLGGRINLEGGFGQVCYIDPSTVVGIADDLISHRRELLQNRG